jgi:hypothetical protein
MHDYCISIEQIRINWEESVADLEKTKEEFITKYNAFKTGLVHYGDKEPDNAETLFWVKPVTEPDPNSFATRGYVKEYTDLSVSSKVDKFTLLTGLLNYDLYQEALTDETKYVLEQYRTDHIVNQLKFKTPLAYIATLDLPCSIPANTNVTFVYTREAAYEDGPMFATTYKAKITILLDSAWVLKEADTMTACNGYYAVEYYVNTYADGRINIDENHVRGTFYKAADVTIARKATITLKTNNWVYDSTDLLYKQTVNVSNLTKPLTANSVIDLKPTPAQLSKFYNKGHTFVTGNNNTVITVYCIGQKPTEEYTLNVEITEVDV